MIPYVNSSFGIPILARVHGSALFKSILPAFISTAIYISMTLSFDDIEFDDKIFIHPYPMQALVTAFTFLLVFRANYSYNRWWEAYTAVYLMHSKWLDMATEIAAFHYQSKRYDDYKPPSFGANPDVQSLETRESIRKIARPNGESGAEGLTPDGSHGAEENTVGFSPSTNFEKDNSLLPPSTPPKKNVVIMAPSSRTRHARRPTLMDLMEQMDACEAEEEQMLQQNLIIDNSDDGSRDDDDTLNPLPTDVEEIDFEKGEGGGQPFERKKRSWFRKLKDKRSQLKAQRKKMKSEEHINRGNALPIGLNTIAYTTSNPGTMNSSKRELINQEKKKTNWNRSRFIGAEAQPATAHLFNQRKSIVRKKGSVFGRSLEFFDRFEVKTGKEYSLFTAASRKHLREGNLDPDLVPPMLFLEEVAHLLSLMSAVAFSTLRNDLPEAESPLTAFEPGLPWPLVDPDGYKAKVRKGWTQSRSRSYSVLQFTLGRSRNDHARTLYNAARPFRVIGNVSDAEIEKLQEARGPLAKVSLVSMWLLELISREYQAGSTGKVAPPIISRLYQFVSDGLAGYNQARKIVYIPFPFPHAQITTLFLLVVDFFVTPLLMSTFVTDVYLGVFLNLFSVLCFTGLHEVAREIENPFQNVPNDVPLNNYQAQFNEGLMVMFYGYHPDFYWTNQKKNINDAYVGDTPSRVQNDREPSKNTASATNELHSNRVQFHRKTAAIKDDGELLLDTAPSDSNLRASKSELLQNLPNVRLTITNDQGSNANESMSVPISKYSPDSGLASNGTAEIESPIRIYHTNSSIVNNPTNDFPMDDFLRNMMAIKLDETSSFRKVPEEDSSRKFSEDDREVRSSPVLFRIPRLTSDLSADTGRTSDAREIIDESDVVHRTKKSD